MAGALILRAREAIVQRGHHGKNYRLQALVRSASISRHLARSAAAAIKGISEELDWPIAESHIDDGKSAFTGENMKTGKLADLTARFIRDGGDEWALTVEKMDRLSRRDSFDVLRWFGEQNQADKIVLAVRRDLGEEGDFPAPEDDPAHLTLPSCL
jgi:hypothetical protein